MATREGYRWSRGDWESSAAERRVLDELVAGRTNAEIAVRLGLSPETVKSHVTHLLGASGCADRRALARWWQARPARPPLVLPLLGLTGRIAAALAACVLAAVLLIVGGSGAARLLSAVRGVALPPEDATPQVEPLAQATPAPTPTPTGAQGAAAVALYARMVAALNRGDAEAVLGMYVEDAAMPGAPCVLGCRNPVAGASASAGVERSFGINCAVWHGYGDACYGEAARTFQVNGQVANGVEITILRLAPADVSAPEYDAVGEIAWSSAAMRAAGEPPLRSIVGVTIKDERLWVTRTELPQFYVSEPGSPPPSEDAATNRRPVDGRVALALALVLSGVVLLLIGSVGLDLYRRTWRQG